MTLDNLEMLIAFAVVMLGVSLLITILTQMASTLLGLRGTNLKWGLTELLRAAHPEFEKNISEIVERALTHPLISDSTLSRFKANIPLLGRWQLASTIRVQELIGILERLSAGTVPLPKGAAVPPGHTLEQAMATIARDARATAGVEVRSLAEQVKTFVDAVTPAAASAGAGSGSTASGSSGGSSSAGAPATPPSGLQPTIKLEDLIGKIPIATRSALGNVEAWFDSTMDRVSQRFALHMRLWTVLFAIVLAFGLKLDSFDLLLRLSTDAKLRSSLASSYAAISETASQVSAAAAQQKPEDAKRAMEDLAKLGSSVRTELDAAGFRLIPAEYAQWSIWPGWKFDNSHFWGFLFSAAMLSLGAPFWFNALKSLSSLKPLLAAKQDREQKLSPATA